MVGRAKVAKQGAQWERGEGYVEEGSGLVACEVGRVNGPRSEALGNEEAVCVARG